MIIGLTGGIASGKSSVVKTLNELGIPVVDADFLARQVVAPGSRGLDMIVEAFGSDILLDGALNRKKMRDLVFSDTKALETLNGITHPLIRQAIVAALDAYRASERALAVLDAPLLLENKLTYLVDEVWVVALDQDQQVRRLIARDKIDTDQAMAIIKRQMPLEEKLKSAQVILDNNGSLEDLKQQVVSLVEERIKAC